VTETLHTLADVAEAHHTTPLVLLRFFRRRGIEVHKTNIHGRWAVSQEGLTELSLTVQRLANEHARIAFLRSEGARIRREARTKQRAKETALTEAAVVARAIRWKPYGSGVYFLIKSKKVIYVGQTVNVIIRVGTHATTKKFDTWHWIPCPRDKLNALERIYIDAFLPPLNRDPFTRMLRSSREVDGTNA